jgi:hypothetical protein
MNARFIITGLLTSALNLLLHGAAYALILKDFYRSHPAGSEAFVKELHRSPDELIGWAMAATSLTMGFFITMVMKWSGAKTLVAGLRSGALVGFLFWSSVNFGLYASSRSFSRESVFVDLASSGLCMTIAAAFAAWMLNRGAGSVR